MAQVKIAADSGGGTIAIKGPATTGSNAAREVTLEDTYSGNATFVTKDSNGNVGVGTSSPSNIGSGYNTIEAKGDATNGSGVVLATSNAGIQTQLISSEPSGIGVVGTRTNHPCTFSINNAEKCRIATDGTFCVGGTGFGAQGAFTVKPNYDDGAAQVITERANTTNVSIVWEMKNNGGQVGRIEHDHTSAALVSGSDYRLKENDVAISDGITRVKQLRPIRFNWKAEPSKTVDGFFAHEVQSIVPEAVSGEKDAVDEDDKIIMQGMVTERLVPLLTAALKEAIAKIETLETKVAALEAG